jgi:hypothetical protein
VEERGLHAPALEERGPGAVDDGEAGAEEEGAAGAGEEAVDGGEGGLERRLRQRTLSDMAQYVR